jgi:hypothetical protein
VLVCGNFTPDVRGHDDHSIEVEKASIFMPTSGLSGMLLSIELVELSGIEPLTSSLRKC